MDRVLVIAPDANDQPGSGLTLAQALTTLASLASATSPYLIVLTPGTYILPQGGTIVPPFVSLRGAGMFTTILQGGLTFTDPKGQVENTFQLDELSIVNGTTGGSIESLVVNAGNVSIDHVFTNGMFIVDGTEANARVQITNSIFQYPLTISLSSYARASILSTEVDAMGSLYAGGLLVCSGVYNASGAFYSNACQAPAAPPSGP